jgi:ArsR family transcriptional regulator
MRLSKNNMGKKLEQLSQKLRICADPNRIRILCVLFENKKHCVSDIAKRLNLDIAITSYHLQALLGEKIIRPAREGKKVCYKLEKNEFLDDLKILICKYKK